MRTYVRILESVLLASVVLLFARTVQAEQVRYLDETVTLGFPPVETRHFEFEAPLDREGLLVFERDPAVVGWVWFNGDLVATPADFVRSRRHGNTFTVGVTFAGTNDDQEESEDDGTGPVNDLAVLLIGKPGRSVGISAVLKPESSAVIGAAGGFLEVTDPDSPIFGASILIPAGALTEDTEISIVERAEPLPNPDPSLIAAGMVVEFEPSGISFAIPATITVPYFPSVHDESLLRLFVQEQIGQPSSEVSPITIDMTAKMLVADIISTFSSFAPFIPPVPGSPIARVSESSTGVQGDKFSGWHQAITPTNGIVENQVIDVSTDGGQVAFVSDATNLVSGDTNGVRDIFVRDRTTNTTIRVSVASDLTQANGASEGPAISGDGRFVAFSSIASNLVPSDTNNTWDVFVHDRDPNGDGADGPDRSTVRISLDAGGNEVGFGFGQEAGRGPSLSDDGRFVAFWVHASARSR